MTDQKEEKITPIKNSEDQEKLKAKYEAEIETAEQKALDWHNASIKKDDTILELQKANKRLAEEKDDWKREAHSARKIQQETKQHKETTDFLTEFKKLQAKKGLEWDETQQTWINTK